MQETHYTQILKKKFEERLAVNPQYSLRAYARDLGLSPSNLSEVLNYKKALSEKSATKISTKLGFNEQEKDLFHTLVNALDGKSKHKKAMARLKISHMREKHSSMREIQEDTFKIISDWYHFAIMELLLVKDFKSDVTWISRQLQVPEMQVKLAIERLIRMELVEEKNGKLVSTNVQLKISNGLPSESIRKFNKQILEKAITSIEMQNVNERYLTTLTSAISKDDYQELTTMIEKFKSKFNKTINAKNEQIDPDQVYCLSMQFFKLS